MDTVGIRELKAHLSWHLKRVRSGARLMVTDRGPAIATISPVEALGWSHLVEQLDAHHSVPVLR